MNPPLTNTFTKQLSNPLDPQNHSSRAEKHHKTILRKLGFMMTWDSPANDPWGAPTSAPGGRPTDEWGYCGSNEIDTWNTGNNDNSFADNGDVANNDNSFADNGYAANNDNSFNDNGYTINNDNSFGDNDYATNNDGDTAFDFMADAGPAYQEPDPDACRRCHKTGHFARDCDQPKPGCFNCGEQGHSKADCTNPRKFTGTCRLCNAEGHRAGDCPENEGRGGGGGACFNCGEEGHNKADCPNPRVFKGTCRICSTEGHPASECPNKPPQICKNCKQEGHLAYECKNPRVFEATAGTEACEDPEVLWQQMIDADRDAEFDDFKKALMGYSRLCPETTLREYELVFRSEKFRTHLVAMEKEIYGLQTIINLQGIADQKYVVTFQAGPKPKRPALVEGLIAQTPEENLDRLDQAGFVCESYVAFCFNCNERGHTSKSCTQERAVREDSNSKVDENGDPIVQVYKDRLRDAAGSSGTAWDEVQLMANEIRAIQAGNGAAA